MQNSASSLKWTLQKSLSLSSLVKGFLIQLFGSLVYASNRLSTLASNSLSPATAVANNGCIALKQRINRIEFLGANVYLSVAQY